MTAEAQDVVLDVEVPATAVHIAAPCEIPKDAQSTSACEVRKAAFPGYRHLKGKSKVIRRKHFNWILGLVLLVVFVCPLLFAADNERNIHQYAHTAWGPKEGCPGTIEALAQTKDGYVWLGTRRGLYRFDGVTFEHYEPASGAVLPSLSVNGLLALDNGDLWIGFKGGSISLLRDGKVKTYGKHEGALPPLAAFL